MWDLDLVETVCQPIVIEEQAASPQVVARPCPGASFLGGEVLSHLFLTNGFLIYLDKSMIEAHTLSLSD